MKKYERLVTCFKVYENYINTNVKLKTLKNIHPNSIDYSMNKNTKKFLIEILTDYLGIEKEQFLFKFNIWKGNQRKPFS